MKRKKSAPIVAKEWMSKLSIFEMMIAIQLTSLGFKNIEDVSIYCSVGENSLLLSGMSYPQTWSSATSAGNFTSTMSGTHTSTMNTRNAPSCIAAQSDIGPHLFSPRFA